MKFRFKGECFSSVAFDETPDVVCVYLDEDLAKELPGLSAAVKASKFDYAIRYHGVDGFEFFDDDGEGFEPDYMIDGCHLRVYPDNKVSFILPLKHSNEELWSEAFNISSIDAFDGEVWI